MTDTLLAGSGDLGRLRYAEACLAQGMSYQAAANAADVCESDLRTFAPGYTPSWRELPPRDPFQRCSEILPSASAGELGRVAALALRLLFDRAGGLAVREVCANIIKALPDTPKTPRSRYMAVVAAVAERHGITLEQITSRSHLYQYARPRQEAYWLLRHEAKLSYPAIGRLFQRDHTTILAGVRAYEKRMTPQ